MHFMYKFYAIITLMLEAHYNTLETRQRSVCSSLFVTDGAALLFIAYVRHHRIIFFYTKSTQVQICGMHASIHYIF